MRPVADRCQDNLLARSRRGPLSAVECRALDAHLGVCDLCRAEVAFGSLFDDVPDRPLVEDDALVSRLADRLAYGGGWGGGIRRRARALALAAGVALLAVAGGAAAWVSLRQPSSPPHPAAGQVGSQSGNIPRGLPAVVVVPSLQPPTPSPPPSPLPPPSRTSSLGRRRASVERAASPSLDNGPSGSPAPTAAELFARANAIRRSHDLRLAVRRYQSLQREYPTSAEALVSLVSAGDLLARLGDPAAALDQFDRYLAEHATGPLAPEALFGRTRCFDLLHRPAEELGAWRELLRRFPASIYEHAGRRRVDELSR